jgi:hypothetical protein
LTRASIKLAPPVGAAVDAVVLAADVDVLVLDPPHALSPTAATRASAAVRAASEIDNVDS